MKTLHARSRALLVMLLGGVLIGIAAKGAEAQSCPGSNLTYIVRDDKGIAIDAGRKDLAIHPNPSAPNHDWGPTKPDFIRKSGMRVPGNISKDRKMVAMTISAMCNFTTPVTVQLTWHGKTMDLTFRVPQLNEQDSRDFLVDSLPFQPGSFEIELQADGTFYPATGWKKAGSKTTAAVTLMAMKSPVNERTRS